MNTGSTTLYAKILQSPQKLGWKEILFTKKRKRSTADLDYAMIAGTTLDTVRNETGMLQKWQQPWLYRWVALAGMGMSLFIFAATLIQVQLLGISSLPALNLLLVIVPPCVMPMTLMILFWEINAPRDISLLELLGCFFAGGVLALMFTVLLDQILPNSTIAPVTEEPAKLLTSLFFIKLSYRKRGQAFGFTGLAMGAAVGAGFSAFESAQYAYSCLPEIRILDGWTVSILYLDKTILRYLTKNILLRGLFSICGHVLYCAPYASIAARNMGKTANFFRSVCSVDFWVMFVISCVCHGLWNHMFDWTSQLLCFAIVTIILWSTALYAIRQNFAQLVEAIPKAAASTALTQLQIRGIRGVHAGVIFSVTHPEILIGSDSSCGLSYPVGMPDLAPIHAKILVSGGGLYLGDMGSCFGSFVNGVPVKPMTAVLLKAGDRFTLGKDQEFEII